MWRKWTPISTMASPMWPSLRLSPSAPRKNPGSGTSAGAHGAFAGCDAGDDLRTAGRGIPEQQLAAEGCGGESDAGI